MKNKINLKILYYCILTSRLSTSFIAGFVVFMILFNYNNLFIISVIHGLIFTLVTMYGFTINDIIDYNKDRIAKKTRPIAENKLSKLSAFIFLSFLLIIIFSLELVFGNINSHAIITFTILLLTIYSYISKYFPILKGIITSILCLSPMLYSNSITHLTTSSIVYFLVFSFIFGRELYMDAQDLKGDLLSNLKTLPYYLGEKFSKKISFIIMILSLMILLIYSILFFNIINIIISFMAFISCLYAFVISFKNEDKAIFSTKITMLLSIISIFYIAG